MVKVRYSNKLESLKSKMSSAGMHVEDKRLIFKIIDQLPSFLSDLKLDYQRQLANNSTLNIQMKLISLLNYMISVCSQSGKPYW
jgi:hypothetical protein